jgi:hypothetical protein
MHGVSKWHNAALLEIIPACVQLVCMQLKCLQQLLKEQSINKHNQQGCRLLYFADTTCLHAPAGCPYLVVSVAALSM